MHLFVRNKILSKKIRHFKGQQKLLWQVSSTAVENHISRKKRLKIFLRVKIQKVHKQSQEV